MAADPEYRVRYRVAAAKRTKRYREADVERAREQARRQKKAAWADPQRRAKMIDQRRVLRYGLRPGEWDERLAAQGGGCAICGRGPGDVTITIDHDHSCCATRTKSCGRCVRGLLCDGCNRALGMFGDDVDRLRAAIAYLTR